MRGNNGVSHDSRGEPIAIIGMACRMPGARDASEFWRNLCEGVQSFTTFTDAELRASGVDATLLTSPRYVRSRGIIKGADQFDAAFFGFTPRDAELTDPQHRILLECAWHALEDAGYVPDETDARIGVFGGVGTNWHLSNAAESPVAKKYASGASIVISNDKDYVATRISYKLGLTGPSINVQSACSTSLVATILGMMSLRAHQCDLVLAGGATIEIPENKGYLHQEGGMESPDGRCRPFDAAANGTVFSRGAGVVVLKRLEDAIRDRDHVYGVILDGAINNDGAEKIGFTAPSVAGQVDLALEALRRAGVSADELSFVEAHGTATPLGDPIEVEALTETFRHYTGRKQFCALGSVKGNIGHTDVASGVAGLIKAAKAVEHGILPASLNFESPNPKIDFAATPLFVNTQLRELDGQGGAVRGLVNSFGVGGTNACLVIETPPARPVQAESPQRNVALLSARNEPALAEQAARLRAHLAENPEIDLAAMAYTLQVGRRRFPVRRAIPFASRDDLMAALEMPAPASLQAVCQQEGAPIAFLFPGQGNQFVGMGRQQYRQLPAFRAAVDRGSEILAPIIGLDLREILFAQGDATKQAAELLDQTFITQPALFLIGYAQAMQWRDWGIEPDVLIGHSVGEYVAACLAGVFNFDDALSLVAARGRIIQDLPGGSMLAVLLPESSLAERLPPDVEIAAVNSRQMTVVAGSDEAIERFAEQLSAEKIVWRHLSTSHAFHSAMMEPAIAPFASKFAGIALQPPSFPIVSTLTGAWLTDAEACDPFYWVRHMRAAVRFADAVETLIEVGEPYLFVECGPGHSLAASVKAQLERRDHHRVLFSQQGSLDPQDDIEAVVDAIGGLWIAGRPIDWDAFYGCRIPGRISLPGYPFEHQSFALDLTSREIPEQRDLDARKPDLGDWLYEPTWTRTSGPALLAQAQADDSTEPRCWLLFDDDDQLARDIAMRLWAAGEHVVRVGRSTAFAERSGEFLLRPGVREDYDELLLALRSTGRRPARILHLWNMTACGVDPTASDPDSAGELAFYSPLFLEQALIAQGLLEKVRLLVVTSGAYSIGAEPVTAPLRALAAGPCRVVEKEAPMLQARLIDVTPHPDLAAQLIDEAGLDVEETIVAYRTGRRFTESWYPVHLGPAMGLEKTLKTDGTYLITGGLGALGLFFAKAFADVARINLVLVHRSDLPAPDRWAEILAQPDCERELRERMVAVQALEAAGATVMLARADVADFEAMRTVVAEARRRFGAIDGVVHSAGSAGGGIIGLKTADMAAVVLDPKVKGTHTIATLFREEPVDFILLFSSVTAVLGEPGRVDYCAANSFMDAVAQEWAQRRPGVLRSLGWAAWAEIGMASRWDEAKVQRREGASRLKRTGATDWLHAVALDHSEDDVYEVRIDTGSDWFIRDHLVAGIPTLVGTSFIEFLHRFAALRHPGASIEITNAYFISPMMVQKAEPRRLMLFLKEHDGRYRFSFRSRPVAAANAWQDHFIGELVIGAAVAGGRHDLDALRGSMSDFDPAPTAVLDVKSEDGRPVLSFGQRWNTVRSVAETTGAWFANLELAPDFAADLGSFDYHPALLDVALTAGHLRMALAAWREGITPEYYLPYGYRRIQLIKPMTGQLWSHIRLRSPHGPGAETVTYDVTILDPAGEVCVVFEGFILKKIDVAARSPRPVAAAGTETIVNDIRPKEGLDVLQRVFGHPFIPHLLITTKDLGYQIETGSPRASAKALREQIEAGARASQKQSRDALATTFEAPANEVENAIAEVWQGILGITEIGVNDDFVELGGNSLLAVQMMSIVSETFHIDLSIETFFRAPTIRMLAQAVIDQLITMADPEVLDELVSKLEA